MTLREKMLTRSDRTCPLRSDCRQESDRRFFSSLFEKQWEVLVIKTNERTGKPDWLTLCCEAAEALFPGEHRRRTASAC